MTINKVAKKLYDNLAFTHKVHEKQCEILSFGSIILRVISIVLVVAVLILQFIQVKNSADQNSALLNWSIGLTVAEIALLAFQLNFNFDKLLDQHRNTAKKALTIKNNFLVYQTNKQLELASLQKFVDEFNELYDSAPQTGNLAEWLAKKSK